MRISDWSSDVCSSDLLRLSVHQASDHPPLAIPEIRLPKALENISYAHACRQLDFFVSIDKRQAKPRSEPPSHSRFANTHHRSEEHTSELQSLMRISYAVFCLKKKQKTKTTNNQQHTH